MTTDKHARMTKALEKLLPADTDIHRTGLISYESIDPETGATYSSGHVRPTEVSIGHEIPQYPLIDTPHRYDGNKHCSICKALKPLSHFDKHPHTLDQKQSYCKTCGVELKRKARAEKPAQWKNAPRRKKRKRG